MVKRSTKTSKKKPKNISQVPFVPCLLTLPPELRAPIISKLGLPDVLNLRLSCHTLNNEVLTFFPAFQVTIVGDRLSWEQLHFVKQIHNLKDITFKRVAKPIRIPNSNCIPNPPPTDACQTPRPTWICSRRKLYLGPEQYWAVGGIQIRSLSAPLKLTKNFNSISERNNKMMPISPKYKYSYDCALLKDYILSLASDDVFNHVNIKDIV